MGICGLFLLSTLSSFDTVSAEKEKMSISADVGYENVMIAEISDDVLVFVPRETGYVPQKEKTNAMLPDYIVLPELHWNEDPYLVRSQAWIKARNLEINGILNNFKRSQSRSTILLT